MSKSSYNYNRKSWEDAEFPILCETCLGVNPYIRMQKNTHGAECKICNRPFTSFRWMPGKGMRYKKTEVCQTCAKLKNVCQTCLLDLEFGLPVQVRDHALAIKDDVPKQGANRDYYVQNADRQLATTDGTTPYGELAIIRDAGTNELLKKLARNQPYYNRNLPHICSFFVKGECTRGEECPYRHEKPTDPDDPLSVQNMRDRYYGQNDPVAEKLLNRAKAMPSLKPPEDPTITTLYVGNLGKDNKLVVNESDLRDYFYQYGEIRQIHVVPNKFCAFIQYTSRQAAELAATRAFNQIVINNQRLTIRWGRPQSQTRANHSVDKALDPVPNIPNICPTPDFLNPAKRPRLDQPPVPPPTHLIVPNVAYRQPPTQRGGGDGSEAGPSSRIYYPSQDPQRLGAKGDVIE